MGGTTATLAIDAGAPGAPEAGVAQPSEREQQLIEECRAGRIAAFERLYRLHGPKLRSVAVNLLGNVSDAEDAVQEAFVRVYRGIGAFEQRSALASWMYRILVNACHDIGRRRRRQRETGLEELGTPPGTGGDPALRMALERGLARLKRREREVFVLFEVEGLRHREIGAVLGISEGASKTLLFEAKRRLRALLMGGGREGRA